MHSPHINDLAGHLNIKLNQNKHDFTSPNCKIDVMHNTLSTAIEKHLKSRHVEIMISHDFISANQVASFTRHPRRGLASSLAKNCFSFLLARQNMRF